MLKSLIAVITSFVLGVVITIFRKDKKIIEIHRTHDRAMDTERSKSFVAGWGAGSEYALFRHGIIDPLD